jgi:hypothetical protein
MHSIGFVDFKHLVREKSKCWIEHKYKKRFFVVISDRILLRIMKKLLTLEFQKLTFYAHCRIYEIDYLVWHLTFW